MIFCIRAAVVKMCQSGEPGKEGRATDLVSEEEEVPGDLAGRGLSSLY